MEGRAIKALTVRQPWCWTIASGLKLVENRSRGARAWQPQNDVALHAGKAWSYRGGNDERVKAAWAEAHGLGIVGKLDARMPGLGGGFVLALFDIADVHPDAGCCEPWGEHEYDAADGSRTTQVTHLVLENVRPLSEPWPLRRGWLGLWPMNEHDAAQIRRRAA